MVFKIVATKFLVFLFIVSCNSQGIEKYIERKENQINIKAPFKVLSQLKHKKGDEPFIVCLREEYAYRFNDLNMHFEHSDIRTLYSNAFNVPRDTFDIFDDTALREQIKPWYVPKKTREITSDMLSKVYEIKMTQECDWPNNRCTVVCNKLAVYELERIKGKWMIVNKKSY